MSPRCCGKNTNFFVIFLHLRHESNLHHFRKPVAGARHCRHFPALAPHHTLPAPDSSPLLPRLTPPVRLAVTTEAAGPLYPQLPRTQGHTASCQNYFRQPDVDYHSLLRDFPDCSNLASSPAAPIGCRHQLAHLVVQNLEIASDTTRPLKESLQSPPGIGELVLPMLDGI